MTTVQSQPAATAAADQSLPGPTHRPAPQPVRVLVLSIATSLGLVAVAFAAFGFVFSGVQQAATQRGLHAELRAELALATSPLGGTIAPGEPIALLDGLGMSQVVVVEGTTAGILRAGPGHRRDTPLPGQPGTSVLYGRSVTYGAPFAELTRSAPGSTITVTTGQGVFQYDVERIRRQGDPLPAPTTGARLTLVTSESRGALRGLAADETVFVDATLRGKPQPAPGARPAGVTDAERAMAGDRTALVPLVFALQALLLVAAGAAWARARWGYWQAWLIGVPVVLALAWVSADTAFVLLPNLL